MCEVLSPRLDVGFIKRRTSNIEREGKLFYKLSEQQRRDNQSNDDIKSLRYEESIQRFLALGIEQIGEPCLQTNTRKSEYEPKCLDALQTIFHLRDLLGANEKRE